MERKKPKCVTSPWVCPECGSRVTKIVNLSDKEKPVTCQVCEASYLPVMWNEESKND